jgi:hypothetical protein
MILSEYLETVFVGTPPVAGWPSDFHIITAWNPRQNATEAENLAADDRLRLHPENEQVEHFRIVGCSGDLVHREAGWRVVGISLERAIHMGRLYVQNTIFDVLNGKAFDQ